MRLPKFEHLKPGTLQEGLAYLDAAGPEASVMAGGTDLLGNLRFGVIKPQQLISIRSLPELREVGLDSEGHLRIGACAILADLAEHPLLVERHPALRDAIKAVASAHIRNTATLGGNLCLAPRCWYYNQSPQWRDSLALCLRTGGQECHAIAKSPRCHAINSSDTAPMLIALGARVILRGRNGERELPLREFYRDDGDFHTALEAGEILTHIIVPKPAPGDRACFIKIQQRRGLDYALGNIGAVRKSDGELNLVINAVSSAPQLLPKTTQLLRSEGLGAEVHAKAATQASKELGVLSTLFTASQYKRRIVEALVKRALVQLQA